MMGYWDEGMREPVDQDRRPDRSITTGFPYQWDPEPTRTVDPETGVASPVLRVLKVPMRVDGLAAYAASRNRPVEQKRDAVALCYPNHRWDDGASALENWVAAVADDQSCGLGDVERMVGSAGVAVQAFVHMLKPEAEKRSW